MSEAPKRFWIDPKREGGPWPSNDSVEYIRADIVEEMREALELLHVEQNGPPLEKYKKRWEEAMAKTEAALKRLEEE